MSVRTGTTDVTDEISPVDEVCAGVGKPGQSWALHKVLVLVLAVTS